MNPKERREFVRNNRTAVYGFDRRKGGPSLSVVYYVMDGDDILVCTMAKRAKALAVKRNPDVSLCVLDEKHPPSYVVVYGKGRIETEGAVDLLAKLRTAVYGVEVSEQDRRDIDAIAEKEERVVVRITPEYTYETPPRRQFATPDTRLTVLADPYGAIAPWNPD